MAIIFGIQIVYVLIKVGIVNEPYPARENGPTGLRKKSPISPFINTNKASLRTHSRLQFFTNRNYIWHTVSMGANKVWDCKWAISDRENGPL